MSFLTQHNVSWNTPAPTRDEFVDLIGPMVLETEPPLTEAQREQVADVIDGACMAKWYDSDPQIAAVSESYPGTVFTLRCHGEDDTRWVTFFKNGSAYTQPESDTPFDQDTYDRVAEPPRPISEIARAVAP